MFMILAVTSSIILVSDFHHARSQKKKNNLQHVKFFIQGYWDDSTGKSFKVWISEEAVKFTLQKY